MAEKKVDADRLVELLVSLGVETAKDWSASRLQEKVNQGSGVAKYYDETSPIKDPDLKSFYDEIVAAQVQGDTIVPEEKSFSLAAEQVAPEVPPATPAGILAEAEQRAEELRDKPREQVVEEFSQVLGVAAESGDKGEVVPVVVSPPGVESENGTPKETVVVSVAAPKPPRKRSAKPTKPARRNPAPKKQKAGTAAPSGRGGRKRTPGRPPADSSYAAKREFWAKNPIVVTDQGPGVMRTVLRELFAAGKGVTLEKGVVGGRKPKPLTKKDLHEVLKAEFEDRDPAKMWTNLNNIVPCRLREHYNLHVWREKMKDGETGYYLVGDGHTPQPGTNYGPRASKPKAGKKGKKAATR